MKKGSPKHPSHREIVKPHVHKNHCRKICGPWEPCSHSFINMNPIENTLINLGAAINVMTLETWNQLILYNILPTSTMFELVDRSKLKPEGILEDVIVSLDSWEYPTYFYVIQPKTDLGGHPFILGISWLATIDSFIGFRSGNMKITHGTKTKTITLYPLLDQEMNLNAHNGLKMTTMMNFFNLLLILDMP
jgi:hypothetical protein